MPDFVTDYLRTPFEVAARISEGPSFVPTESTLNGVHLRLVQSRTGLCPSDALLGSYPAEYRSGSAFLESRPLSDIIGKMDRSFSNPSNAAHANTGLGSPWRDAMHADD